MAVLAGFGLCGKIFWLHIFHLGHWVQSPAAACPRRCQRSLGLALYGGSVFTKVLKVCFQEFDYRCLELQLSLSCPMDKPIRNGALFAPAVNGISIDSEPRGQLLRC